MLFGDDWIPGGETDSFVVHLAYWMKYEEFVHERMARYGIEELSEDVKWNPELFYKESEKWEMIENNKKNGKTN